MAKLIYASVLSGIGVSLFAVNALGQQTIFNVPTSDVLDRGKVYAELDLSFKANDQDALQKFSSFVPRIVVGAGKKVEIGFNVTGNIQPGADSTALVPTVKWKFYDNEKTKLALFGGSNFYIPVRNRTYDFGSYSYAAVSKSIGNSRLTAGGFVASKNVFAPHAVRGGGQFGFEHTVNSKVTFAADWITGRHASGYLTSGIIYKPQPKVTTYWGYSVGNDRLAIGNHFFLVELGYNIN